MRPDEQTTLSPAKHDALEAITPRHDATPHQPEAPIDHPSRLEIMSLPVAFEYPVDPEPSQAAQPR
jgi:hypothetical protein